MKQLLIVLLCFCFLYSDDSEKQFWDEVKNSSDIELLELYKKQYPKGTFERIADIKIKRLTQSNQNKNEDINSIPSWIRGTTEYSYYAIGKANKHFKGKYYQENLAKSRAMRKLIKLFDDKKLSNTIIERYSKEIEKKKYTDPRGRIYILLYIDDYNL